MSEWLSYRPQDFLLFSARSYFRLFERFNADHTGINALLWALGALVAVRLLRGDPRVGRAAAGLFAAAWAWGAWFVWHYYRPINWVAPWLLPLYAVEVAMLLWLALRPTTLAWRRDAQSAASAALFALALFGYPLSALLRGDGWAGVQGFGNAPDATAVATLGVGLAMRGPGAWRLCTPAWLWLAASALVLTTMDDANAGLPLAAMLICAVALIATRRNAARA